MKKLWIFIPLAIITLIGTLVSVYFVKSDIQNKKRIAKNYNIDVYDIVEIDGSTALVNDNYYCNFDPTYTPSTYTIELDTIPAKQLEIREVELAVNRQNPNDFYVAEPEPVWISLLIVVAVLSPLAFLATLHVLTKAAIEEKRKKVKNKS